MTTTFNCFSTRITLKALREQLLKDFSNFKDIRFITEGTSSEKHSVIEVEVSFQRITKNNIICEDFEKEEVKEDKDFGQWLTLTYSEKGALKEHTLLDKVYLEKHPDEMTEKDYVIISWQNDSISYNKK